MKLCNHSSPTEFILKERYEEDLIILLKLLKNLDRKKKAAKNF